MNGKTTAAIFASTLWFSGLNAQAVQIVPKGYEFSPNTTSARFDYSDNGGTQLTDGVLANNLRADALEALPWVGWYASEVVITFSFGATFDFDTVGVNALQLYLNNVALPDIAVATSLDGLIWTPSAQLVTPESTQNDKQSKLLTLDNIGRAQYLQVTLSRNDQGPWIMVDEIGFTGTAVPEGGNTLLLLSLSFVAFAGLRKLAQA